ncbi:MAG: hypothetical protein FJ118_06410 [Deltaproteobacteria bacterium]|nr:hypothetical protein [Deltaproteobacteria bacterium]
MIKPIMMAVCVIVAISLAVPVSWADGSLKDVSLRKIPGQAYSKGANIAKETEYHVTEIMRNTFSLFNPCLDLIKGCTGVIMTPLEGPLSIFGKPAPKAKASATKPAETKIPPPEKPALPQAK